MIQLNGMLDTIQRLAGPVNALQPDRVIQPRRRIVGVELFGQLQIFFGPAVILDFIKCLAEIAAIERNLRLQQGRFANFVHCCPGLIAPE